MNPFWLSSFLTLTFFAAAQANISKENISEIKNKITVEKKKLLETEIQKRGVMAALYEINREVNKISIEMNQLQDQLNSAQKKIETQTSAVVRLERDRDAQKKKLSQRLRALYKMGSQGYASVVLSSQSSQELNRNVKFLGIVVANDSKLLMRFKKTIDELQSEQVRLKSAVRNYLITEKELTRAKSELAIGKEKQTELLNQIEQDKNMHLQALKEWRQAGLAFEERFKGWAESNSDFDEIKRIAFFEKQGALRPPVASEIKQKYGIYTENRFDIKMFHKGIFFAANPGDIVTSLYSGRVVHSGWISGFGETVIIDHGDHYYSVYAHLSQIKKTAGTAVKTGEVIGHSGDTGSLRGPGLYLEVRHFSESLDPLPWLDLHSEQRL